MKRSTAIRTFSVAMLGCLIGLIAARVSSFGQESAQFSWAGFSIGLGAVLLAFLVSRPFARSVNANPPGTVLQRKLLSSVLLCFLGALLSFTIFLYTGWSWSKILLALAIVGGACSVFVGLVVTWFSPRHEV